LDLDADLVGQVHTCKEQNMQPQLKFSDCAAVMATLDPASVAASTVVSGWVSMDKWHSIAAILQTGVLGASATVDAKLRQATDGSGTGAKDITGKAITQLVKASHDNKQVVLQANAEDLDVNGGFTHVALSVTVGTAASLLSAVLLGVNGRFEAASDFDDADVVQIV
jgi:hypothetical protein